MRRLGARHVDDDDPVDAGGELADVVGEPVHVGALVGGVAVAHTRAQPGLGRLELGGDLVREDPRHHAARHEALGLLDEREGVDVVAAHDDVGVRRQAARVEVGVGADAAGLVGQVGGEGAQADGRGGRERAASADEPDAESAAGAVILGPGVGGGCHLSKVMHVTTTFNAGSSTFVRPSLKSDAVTRGAVRARIAKRTWASQCRTSSAYASAPISSTSSASWVTVDRLERRRAPRCCRSSTSRGRGRPDPSRGGRTRRSRPRCTTCRPAARRCGTGGGSAAASTRRAWSRAGCGPGAARGRGGRSRPAAGRGEVGAVVEHARLLAVDLDASVLRSPSSSVSTQSAFVTVPARVQLPVVRGELGDEAGDPLLVVLVGEVRAEGAAADVGGVGVDALAPLAEDARVGARSARSGRSGTPGRRRRDRRTRRTHGGRPGRLRARDKPSGATPGLVAWQACAWASSTSDPTPATCWWSTRTVAPPRCPASSHKQPLRLAEHLDDDGAVTKKGIKALTDFCASATADRRGQGLRGDARLRHLGRARLGQLRRGARPRREAQRRGARGAVRGGRGAADVPGRTPLVRLVGRPARGLRHRRRLARDRRRRRRGPRRRLVAAAGRRPDGADLVRRRPARPTTTYASCASRSAPRSPATPATCCAPGVPDRAAATSKTFRSLARICGAAPSGDGPLVPRALELETLVGLDPQADGALRRRARRRCPASRRAAPTRSSPGALVAEACMDIFDLPELEICPWALREGVILERLDQISVVTRVR